jgi:hypothetical protein
MKKSIKISKKLERWKKVRENGRDRARVAVRRRGLCGI